jgi:sodium-dependent phosphate transporter
MSNANEQTHVVLHGSAFGAVEPHDAGKPNSPPTLSAAEDKQHSTPAAQTWKERIMRGVEYDIHGQVEEDPVVAAIHANAEKWDDDTEYIFGYLQVISAVCVIFAHGAGEVGYMAGPLAVIFDIVKHPGKNVVTNGGVVMPEIWTILIGAFGLLIGLATYGYKVCAAVGTQMAKITPSRGYAAELATSFVIMIAAQFGLPTSSSQCITGGIMGIALFEGAKGINFHLVGLTAMSWVWTILVMGLGTALIFSQGIYAPNKFQTLGYSDKLLSYQSV